MSRFAPTAAPRRAALTALTTALLVAPTASAEAAAPVEVSAKPIAQPLSTTKQRSTAIVVRNASRRSQRGLTVSVRAAKGVSIRLAGAGKGRLSRKLKPLAAGDRARIGVSLRRTAKGPKQGRLRVTVSRKGKAVATGRLAFGAKGAGAPTPAPPPNSLAGRYFWGSTYTLNGIRQRTLYFTGPDLVYTAATGSAWPTCTAVTDDCRPYAYDGATGALTIDGLPATLEGRKLTVDGDTYREWGFPPAGARWDAKVTHSNSSGICPLYCSYYTENLTFLSDGTFVRDAVSSGSSPVVDWASVPPDSKGTYEVRADRTLRLAYADGTERIETVAVYLDDAGNPEPPGEGLLLGGDGYFDIRD